MQNAEKSFLEKERLLLYDITTVMLKPLFESRDEYLTILNPFRGFTPEVHHLEIRKDPLLGDTSVYNPYLRDKANIFFGDNDQELLERVAVESAKTCFLCGEAIERNAARYPEDLVPGGCITEGEATLFANLFSIAKYHAVVRLGKRHFLSLSEFSPNLLRDGLAAARQFMEKVCHYDHSVCASAVCANYLFPAGASLVHPHLQVLASPGAYSYHARLLDATRSYYDQYRSPYHSDLIEQEKTIGQRYIAQTGSWHWLASFSPSGSNEIIGIHEQKADYTLLSEPDLLELATGITKVLACYESLGHLSFNYAIFSIRERDESRHVRCMAKIISRQNLSSLYRNDDYFLQKMLQAELIIIPPEELAQKMKTLF